jgi:hypothetical protein
MPYSRSTQKRIDNAWRRYREAEREGRDLTPEEQAEIDEAVDASSRERSQHAFTKALGGEARPIEEGGELGVALDPGAADPQRGRLPRSTPTTRSASAAAGIGT